MEKAEAHPVEAVVFENLECIFDVAVLGVYGANILEALKDGDISTFGKSITFRPVLLSFRSLPSPQQSTVRQG